MNYNLIFTVISLVRLVDRIILYDNDLDMKKACINKSTYR